MIKLHYKEMNIEDLTIYYAKYRKNRNIKISINNDNQIRVTCPYLTPDFAIKDFVSKKIDWIRDVLKKNDENKNIIQYRKITKIERKELLYRIMQLVHKYETLMNTAVSHVTLRDMKTLWGSCSYKTHRIRFSTRLYFTSYEFMEYVVVHEMAHIFVPNHSKEFYDIVRRYIPNYKYIRKHQI